MFVPRNNFEKMEIPLKEITMELIRGVLGREILQIHFSYILL